MKFRITNDDEVFSSRLREGTFLEIQIEGFGEKEALEGEGTLIAIEIRDGVPVIHMFSDINIDGPTHTINCKHASEKERQK